MAPSPIFAVRFAKTGYKIFYKMLIIRRLFLLDIKK